MKSMASTIIAAASTIDSSLWRPSSDFAARCAASKRSRVVPAAGGEERVDAVHLRVDAIGDRCRLALRNVDVLQREIELLAFERAIRAEPRAKVFGCVGVFAAVDQRAQVRDARMLLRT